MKILQELLALKEESNKVVVDLENFTGKTIPHEAWPNGVMYKGMNVYKTIYDGGPAESQLAKEMDKVVEDFDGKLTMQESYLGYSPSRDIFIQGYDGWATVEDTGYDHEMEGGDEHDMQEMDHNCSPYVVFRLTETGSIKVQDEGSDYSNGEEMWYGGGQNRTGRGGGGLKRAHKNFSDLIDIRLD